MLKIENLTVDYGGENIIDHFDLRLERGEILALFGTSGSGKTTILKALAGLIPVSGGRIILDGRRLSDKTGRVNPEDRRVGMVFQDYALFPHLTVGKNIAFGLAHLGKKERAMRVRSLLGLVGLSALEKHYPDQLSGGQKQRVALIRSLANAPKLLLLDEPFSNLDEANKNPLLASVREILKTHGITTIFVTHSLDEAALLADRTVVLDAAEADDNLRFLSIPGRGENAERHFEKRA